MCIAWLGRSGKNPLSQTGDKVVQGAQPIIIISVKIIRWNNAPQRTIYRNCNNN